MDKTQLTEPKKQETLGELVGRMQREMTNTEVTKRMLQNPQLCSLEKEADLPGWTIPVVTLDSVSAENVKKWCEYLHAARYGQDIANNDRGADRLLEKRVGTHPEVAWSFWSGLHGRYLGERDWNIYSDHDPRRKEGYDWDGGRFGCKANKPSVRHSRINSWLCNTASSLIVDPHDDDEIFLAFADGTGRCSLVGSVMAVDVLDLWEPAKRADLVHRKQALYCSKLFEKGVIKPAPGVIIK